MKWVFDTRGWLRWLSLLGLLPILLGLIVGPRMGLPLIGVRFRSQDQPCAPPGGPWWRRRKCVRVVRRGRRRRRRRRRLGPGLHPAGATSFPTPPAARPEASGAPDPPPAVAAALPAADRRSWVAQEVAGVHLGDTRLDNRLGLLVEQLAQQPTASIPQACGTPAATKAAYRFFANDRVSHAQILAGHRQVCLARVAGEPLVLVLQDTTSLDYTAHPKTTGLGPLENKRCQGLFVHSALAVSAAGVPLGLLDQQVWARDPATVGKRHRRRSLPIAEKESYKWLRGLRATLPDLPPQVCVVTVADREADIFDLFGAAADQHAHLLVRSAWNRRLAGAKQYLWETVGATAVQGTAIVQVGRAKDRRPRAAVVEVRCSPVTVQPPRHRQHEPGLRPLALYAIEVREPQPPPQQAALHWLLLTNRPVADFAAAQECVRWYGLRWLIERYHFVLKSGCRIEERQLETSERLQRCLGVYAIVAWRLLWLTYQARETPEASCAVALKTHEWQALYCYLHKTPIPPPVPPTLRQAVRWIAQLGGFLGRKGDGEPGAQVLWRGWQRLQDIAETWALTHPPPDVGNA